jgi:hypothetical protein
MSSIVLVYSKFQNIKDLIEKISKLNGDVILAKDIERGLGFLNFNNVQIFAIDSSYKLNETDLIKLQNINNELFLINFENKLDFGQNVSTEEFVKFLSNNSQENKNSINKSPRIFRDYEQFKNVISQEVRRAKRYRYPFVVVMFKVDNNKYTQQIINYFASKIREFDALWIYDEKHFSMILPHTGWNGAEILTNRLTNYITAEIGVKTEVLKNIILSFKRVEKDTDFLARINNALNNQYYNANKQIDFNIWKEELFAEFSETKTIRVFNRYKGMLISHDSDMELLNDKLQLLNIRELQFKIIDLEKATYFFSENLKKAIRAEVEFIDREHLSVILSHFEIVDLSLIKTNVVKLLIEENLKIKIKSSDDFEISGEIIELSLDEVSVHLNRNLDKDANYYLEFYLPKVKYKIIAEGKIKDIEMGEDTAYIDFQIITSVDANMKISEFLAKKQLQFIKELNQ